MQRILQPSGHTTGVAQLNNNIYVLSSTILTVYDAVSFERLGDVVLALKENLSHGHSIAACSVNQCLYIADRYRDGSIIRLEIKNGGKTVKWMNTTVDVMYNKNCVHLYSYIVNTK